MDEELQELKNEISRLKLENQAYSDSADTLIAEQDKFAKEQRRLAVKEFAKKLKEVIHERDYVQGYAEIGLIEDIDELLEENEE